MPAALALVPALAPLMAAAHDGHGLAAAHWHATDAWGVIALAVGAGAALWWRGRK